MHRKLKHLPGGRMPINGIELISQNQMFDTYMFPDVNTNDGCVC